MIKILKFLKETRDKIKTEKALESAEKMFKANRCYSSDRMTHKQWRYLNDKYDKLFFSNK